MKLIKQALPCLFVLVALMSCTNESTNNTNYEESPETMMTSEAQTSQQGTIMFIVRGKTTLSEEEMESKMKERAPQFEALPGLIQKYYIKSKNPGEYGGVYIWDSMESFTAYKQSDLVKSIAEAYKMTGPPSTELVDIMFELRE